MFAVALTGANIIPVAQCPDEAGRRLLSDWIYDTGTLPTGNEYETYIELWGFSYALRPFLSAMIGAFFMRLTSIFTSSAQMLLATSRMSSVLSITACCFFCLKLGHRIFKERRYAVMLAVFVCFLPQVMFLGMYQNNDILGLASVSAMLYFLAEGADTCWSIRSCIGLSVSFSVGLLSYYSVYVWLLMGGVFCVISVLHDKRIGTKPEFLIKHIALVCGICILLAGWFFIRNALLHNGDLLGIASEAASRRALEEQGYTLQPYVSLKRDGYSIPDFFMYHDGEFIKWTLQSLIGVFGYMDIRLPGQLYRLYYAVFLLCVILYLLRILRHKPDFSERLMMFTVAAAAFLSFILHFWTSYTRDYQPQGRYIISSALLLGIMLSWGLEYAEKQLNNKAAETVFQRILYRPSVIMSVLWSCMFVISAALGMTQMLL